MKEFKLISMTDFVLSVRGIKKDNIRRFWACEKYAEFLKQPLKLEFFVPCDDEVNVLEEPFNQGDLDYFYEKRDKYEKAKNKVLFEGFKLVEWHDNTFEIVSDTSPNFITVFKKLKNKDWEARFNTAEDLTKTIIDIELTESAIKQIGL